MYLGYPTFLLIMLVLSKVYCSGSNRLADDVIIRDGNETMTYHNGTFKLGFFGNYDARFLGIWHYPSKIFVWVANRDNPLPDSNGCFAKRDGKAVVLDANGTIYWSTDNDVFSTDSEYVKVAFGDSGNLNFNIRGGLFWESFSHPTDTFLPGMRSDSLTLTSWKSGNNPAPGDFTLLLQQKFLTVSNKGLYYWENRDIDFDGMPKDLSDLLLGNSSRLEHNSRLVMNFTGQVQFWKWEGKRGWSLVWSEPKDNCSFDNVCGDFGSCNSDNGRLCKCLPGFKPNADDKWGSGDFSGGCFPKSKACSRTFSDDIFLRLPKMKVGAANHNGSTAGQDCEMECRKQCDCVAYSCGVADCKEAGTLPGNGCQLWRSTDLTNLQEGYSQGFNIFIRTNKPDIPLTSRGCEPCGTNVIPYPLSTSANCGDPSYFNFSCSSSTGQLNFTTSKGAFKVTAINPTPEANTFTIQIKDDNNCDRTHIESLILSPKPSSLFRITNCSLINQSFAGVQHLFMEVEIAWKPPPEPTCKNLSDCNDWPQTTCKAARGGKMRCICGSKFRWHGSLCKKVSFPLRLVVSCISGVLAVVLLGSILFILHRLSKRRMATKQDSVELQGDDIDTGSIDVPFFEWGSIVAATNNFADANKLGRGGFGAVYKGMLPDGKEIAVKRLSIVSEQGVKEFKTEVVLIAKLQHRNLVRLLGYCVKAVERILLYEYMPNGSLDSCLFDQTRSVFLDWEKRFDIIFGIARGLLYLHQDSRLRIIHRDLKPSNILLDEEMNPKISDFGIARIVGGKETEGSTKRVVGTYGYMAPEYAYEGLFSVKSDVFSFGVVVLETIRGRRNSKLFQLEHGLNLQGYAWKMWNEDKGMDVMDETLKESYKLSEVLKCIHIGLLCVQEDPSDRPTMSAVVLMLGSEGASLPPPKQPAFISKKETSETASSSSKMDSSFNDVFTFSSAGR